MRATVRQQHTAYNRKTTFLPSMFRLSVVAAFVIVVTFWNVYSSLSKLLWPFRFTNFELTLKVIRFWFYMSPSCHSRAVWPDWAIFAKFLATKFLAKVAQMIGNFLGYSEKTHSNIKTALTTLGRLFGKNCATFYCNIWSHCSRGQWQTLPGCSVFTVCYFGTN